jgi:pimeloyl-ACP methyl ester carboxylesterase
MPKSHEPASPHQAQSASITREAADWKTPDGTHLRGYVYSSDLTPPERAPTVLVLHGLGSSVGNRTFDPLLCALALNGYLAFAYDFRGHGMSRSPGEPAFLLQLSSTLWRNVFVDAADAVSWVLGHPRVDPGRVVCLGVSLGGAIALSTLLHDEQLRGLVAVAPPYDYREILRREYLEGPVLNRLVLKFFRRRLRGLDVDDLLQAAHEVSPVSKIRDGTDYGSRVFIAQCADDQVVRPAYNFHPLVDRLRLPPRNLLLFETGGHTFHFREQAYLARCLAWIHSLLS